jgi:hypothetical protein
MPRPHRDDIDWLGIGVRGICGAALGALIGFGWMVCFADTGELNWLIVGAAIVVFAGLSIRFGDRFWMNLRGWFDWF